MAKIEKDIVEGSTSLHSDIQIVLRKMEESVNYIKVHPKESLSNLFLRLFLTEGTPIEFKQLFQDIYKCLEITDFYCHNYWNQDYDYFFLFEVLLNTVFSTNNVAIRNQPSPNNIIFASSILFPDTKQFKEIRKELEKGNVLTYVNVLCDKLNKDVPFRKHSGPLGRLMNMTKMERYAYEDCEYSWLREPYVSNVEDAEHYVSKLQKLVESDVLNTEFVIEANDSLKGFLSQIQISIMTEYENDLIDELCSEAVTAWFIALHFTE
uniref:Uncharacterized protein n=1 Tax=Ixodes ricinus TaxID=34613 RepID=A0A0K8R3C2_IXORI